MRVCLLLLVSLVWGCSGGPEAPPPPPKPEKLPPEVELGPEEAARRYQSLRRGGAPSRHKGGQR